MSGLICEKEQQKTLQPHISNREREILQLISKSYTSKAIADTLFLSKRTIDFHRSNLLRKFAAKNAVMLIRKAIDNGILK